MHFAFLCLECSCQFVATGVKLRLRNNSLWKSKQQSSFQTMEAEKDNLRHLEPFKPQRICPVSAQSLFFRQKKGATISRNSFIESWWAGLDSNQRTQMRADLQSAAFNHSATYPLRVPVSRKVFRGSSRDDGGEIRLRAIPCKT